MSRCQTCVHSIPIFVTSDIYTDGFGQVCCDCKTKVKDGYEPRDKTKKGKWVDGYGGEYRCTNCSSHSERITPYCWCCGARMKGGKE